MIIFNEHDQNSKIVISFDESSFLVNILGDKNYQFSIKFQRPQNPTGAVVSEVTPITFNTRASGNLRVPCALLTLFPDAPGFSRKGVLVSFPW